MRRLRVDDPQTITITITIKMLGLPEIHVYFSFKNKNTKPVCMSYLQDYLKALDKNSGGINHPETYLTLVKYHDCQGKELQAHRFISYGMMGDEIGKKEVEEINKNGASSVVYHQE